jgi:hypothetical protein
MVCAGEVVIGSMGLEGFAKVGGLWGQLDLVVDPDVGSGMMLMMLRVPIHKGRIVLYRVGIGGWWAQGFHVDGSRHCASTICCVVLLWRCSVLSHMWCPGGG